MSKEEVAKSEEEGKEYSKSIQEFKTKIDSWRSGEYSDDVLNSEDAVEKLEALFNYYLGDATKSFSESRTVEYTIEIPSSELKWDSKLVVLAFEQIKQNIVKSYAALEGSGKGIRLIDLGAPEFKKGGITFHLHINLGYGQVKGEQKLSEIDSRNSHDLKWGNLDPTQDVLPASVTCLGAANVEIGKAANINIGYFLQNLPPNFIGNPNQVPNVVLSGIVNILTNKDAVPSPAVSSLFVKNTLSLTYNPVATGAPTYPNKGQYKIHCDFPSDEFCFGLTKIINYGISNVDVGNSSAYKGQVRSSSISRSVHELVGTYVLSKKDVTQVLPTTTAIVREHPTFHYYARPIFIIKEAPIEPAEI